VGALLILIGALAFLISLVALIRPIPRLGLRNRKLAALAAVAAFVVFRVGVAIEPFPEPSTAAEPQRHSGPAMAGPAPPGAAATSKAKQPSPAPAPPKPSLRSANKYVLDVSAKGGVLSVELMLPQPLFTTGYIDLAADSIEDLGASIQGGAAEADAVDRVSAVFFADAKDRLGNMTKSWMMTLNYPAADLRAARFNNLSVAETLDLADTAELSPAAESVLLAWCRKREPGDPGTRFCLQALT
jgi:hypothetical protein